VQAGGETLTVVAERTTIVGVKVTGFEVFPVVCPPPFRGGRTARPAQPVTIRSY
jgi:hypothetical protein